MVPGLRRDDGGVGCGLRCWVWIAVLGVDCGVRCGICATIKGLKMVPGLRRDDDGKLRANGSIYWFAIT